MAAPQIWDPELNQYVDAAPGNDVVQGSDTTPRELIKRDGTQGSLRDDAPEIVASGVAPEAGGTAGQSALEALQEQLAEAQKFGQDQLALNERVIKGGGAEIEKLKTDQQETEATRRGFKLEEKQSSELGQFGAGVQGALGDLPEASPFNVPDKTTTVKESINTTKETAQQKIDRMDANRKNAGIGKISGRTDEERFSKMAELSTDANTKAFYTAKAIEAGEKRARKLREKTMKEEEAKTNVVLKAVFGDEIPGDIEFIMNPETGELFAKPEDVERNQILRTKARLDTQKQEATEDYNEQYNKARQAILANEPDPTNPSQQTQRQLANLKRKKNTFTTRLDKRMEERMEDVFLQEEANQENIIAKAEANMSTAAIQKAEKAQDIANGTQAIYNSMADAGTPVTMDEAGRLYGESFSKTGNSEALQKAAMSVMGMMGDGTLPQDIVSKTLGMDGVNTMADVEKVLGAAMPEKMADALMDQHYLDSGVPQAFLSEMDSAEKSAAAIAGDLGSAQLAAHMSEIEAADQKNETSQSMIMYQQMLDTNAYADGTPERVFINKRVAANASSVANSGDEALINQVRNNPSLFRTLVGDERTMILKAGVRIPAYAALTPGESANLQTKINTRYMTSTKDARDTLIHAKNIDAAYKDYLESGSLKVSGAAIVTAFGKILDPGSVVRESEFRTLIAGQDWFSRLEGYWKAGTETGGPGLSEGMMDDFYRLTKKLADGYIDYTSNQADFALNLADQYEYPYDLVLDDQSLQLTQRGRDYLAQKVARGGQKWNVAGDTLTTVPQKMGTDVSSIFDLIKGFEGYSSIAKDDYKQMSIGYGTNAGDRETITEPEARADAVAHIESDLAFIDAEFQDINPNQRGALASFIYNLGKMPDAEADPKGHAQRQVFYDAIRRQDLPAITSYWSQYVTAGGETKQHLVNRRQKELQIFLSPYTATPTPPSIESSTSTSVGGIDWLDSPTNDIEDPYNPWFEYKDDGNFGNFARMLGNTPKSAWKFGGELVTALRHPVRTGKALGKAVTGALINTIDQLPEGMQPSGPRGTWQEIKTSNEFLKESESVAEAIGDFYGEKYGSWEAATKHIIEDPVAVLGDATALVGSAAALAPKGSKIAQLGSVATKLDPGVALFRAPGAVKRALPKRFQRNPIEGAPAAETLAAAENLGISESKIPATAKIEESVQRKMFQNFGKKSQWDTAEFSKEVARVTDEFGKEVFSGADLEAAGTRAVKAHEKFKTDFRATSKRMFDDIKVPDDVKVQPMKTKEAVTNIIKKLEETIVKDPAAKEFKSILEEINKKKTLTYDELKNSRSAIGRKTKDELMRSQYGAELDMVYSAMTEDLFRVVKKGGNTPAVKNFEAANKFYREGAELLKSDIAKALAKKDPAKMVDEIFKANQPERVRTFKKIAGEEAFGEMKAAFVEKLFQKSSKEGVLNGAAVRKQMGDSGYGQAFMREVFTPDEIAKLEKVSNKADDINAIKRGLDDAIKAEKGVPHNLLNKIVNVFGNLGSLAFMSALAFSQSPALLVGLVGGNKLLQRLVRSGRGERALTGSTQAIEASRMSKMLESPFIQKLKGLKTLTPDQWQNYLRIINESKDGSQE